jgi:AcrR family transcriptional regulator
MRGREPALDAAPAPGQLAGMLTSVNKAARRPPLDAALAVLRRDGPTHLTMRLIAAEAGITATALYRHYDDKEALLRDVVRAVYGVFKAYMLAEAEGAAPSAWLRLGISRYRQFALDHPKYYELLFVTPHGIGIDRYPTDFLRGKSPTFRRLTDAVSACMESGALRRGVPADVALSIFAHMHGLIMLHFAGRFGDDADTFRAFYDKSMEHLLTGLR